MGDEALAKIFVKLILRSSEKHKPYIQARLNGVGSEGTRATAVALSKSFGKVLGVRKPLDLLGVPCPTYEPSGYTGMVYEITPLGHRVKELLTEVNYFTRQGGRMAVDNDKIKKLMGMLSSDNDHEALTAARKLVEELQKGGVHPSEAMVHTADASPKKKTPRGAKDQEIAWLEHKVERLAAQITDLTKDRDWWKQQYDQARESYASMSDITLKMTKKWDEAYKAAQSWRAEAERLKTELTKTKPKEGK